MPVIVRDETHFAPYDDPATVLVDLADSATRSIHIDIYGFTYGPLMDALISAHANGIDVRIVADHSQSAGAAERVQLQRLVDAGIDVLVGTSSRGGIDHSKYIVIDGDLGPSDPRSVVGFGSFNFSESARAQDNTFSVRNDAGLVAAFMANWQRVHDDAFDKHPEWQVAPSAAEGAS
jgi:phosphatidylserine/phosphatidylglycerophosphate/cardiolipin synthase-like enzyme